MLVARPREQRARTSWLPSATTTTTEDTAGGLTILARPTLAHFKDFCSKLRLDNGQPFVIEPFQEVILADYFDGVTETLILLPSSNGKTTLLAALALHHLLYTQSPEVFIAAASRDQAGRMHTHIAGFVARSRDLKRLVNVKRRGATLSGRAGSLEVLAADAGTVDGIGGTLIIIDELHRHRDDSLYVVARKGLKKRNGQILHCSTAGDSMHSPLGRIRARCLKLPNLARTGMHSFARADDDSLAYHEYALGDGDDAHDMAVVKQANPLAALTERQLKGDHESQSWYAWARFQCGLWIAGEGSAISPVDWAAVQHEHVPFDSERPQLLAVDLAWVRDTTAINAIQALDRLDVRVRNVATVVPNGETILREAEILGPIQKYVKKHRNCRAIVIDPEAGGRALIEKLEALGLQVIEHSQKDMAMCDAAAKFEMLIRLRVDDEDPDSRRALSVQTDETVNEHVLAAARNQLVDGRWRLDKRRKNPECIDNAVSIAMGTRVALAELEPKPKRGRVATLIRR